MFKKIVLSLFLILCIGAESVYAQVLLEDSLALVEFYDSTDGDNWTYNDNWNDGPVSTWYGVIVDTGRVIYLHLPENNLRGTIPSSIGNLSDLRLIYLQDNELTGTIPSSIGNLSDLQSLFLFSNQLTGTIPPEIGNLSNLQYLELINNQLTGTIPPEIGNLSNLIRLNLALNQLTGTIPSSIGNLSDLITLYLSNNQLTGTIPPEIGDLSNLRYLFLYYNELTDLPDLSSLTSLEYLYIQNNRFTFEDIEPNIGVPSNTFSYSPQDSVGEARDTTMVEGLNLTVSVSIGGENNLYLWKKDGNIISGATGTSYTISSVDFDDAGSYACEITNTVATALTLYSRPVNVTVIPPYITVISPNGAEVWQADNTYDITWISAGTTGNVRIEYSTDNGFSWIQITGSTVDDGSYSWRIPNTPSDNCLIRVKNWSGSPSDISNSLFSISSSSAVPELELPEVYSLEVKGMAADKTLELRYALPEEANIKFSVYDITGKKIKEFSAKQQAGYYSRKIDMLGKPAGVYFVRMKANGEEFAQTDKFILVK